MNNPVQAFAGRKVCRASAALLRICGRSLASAEHAVQVLFSFQVVH